MKFRVRNGVVEYQKPGWTRWTKMKGESDGGCYIPADGKTFKSSLLFP